MSFTAPEKCFYPRHPRGWRRNNPFMICCLLLFLSTPPSRVATKPIQGDWVGYQVSIHATLAGGDRLTRHCSPFGMCFYPRHPRGWRPISKKANSTDVEFLSTPPSRVATLQGCIIANASFVSIHATLAGGDARSRSPMETRVTFLSPPPSRVATSWGR